MFKERYHTQEKRRQRLTAPIPTERDDAWLGSGYYFWYDQDEAVRWGISSKRKYGYYEVYKAGINFENVLDTVFNEDHYWFWVKNIEKAINNFYKKKHGEVNLKYINDFLREKGVYDELDGVQFQDISDNPQFWVVSKFQYKKRIQIAVYNKSIITNFAFVFEGKCI